MQIKIVAGHPKVAGRSHALLSSASELSLGTMNRAGMRVHARLARVDVVRSSSARHAGLVEVVGDVRMMAGDLVRHGDHSSSGGDVLAEAWRGLRHSCHGSHSIFG
jgi:hypothetical protein